MKKGIAVCIMVFLGLMWSTTAFSNEYDFRKTNWGMSMEEVAEAEDALELQYGDSPLPGESYEAKAGGLDCYINYYYIGDKLTSAEYEFSYESTLEYLCINNYSHLKEKLVEKYGEPIRDEDIWIDDLYKDNPKNWGRAITRNHLLRYGQWETPNTRITIILAGDEYGNIALKIKYRSQRIKEFEEEFTVKEILEVF
ncbi:hypothetical protein ES703_123662 [subsurface metagenome]